MVSADANRSAMKSFRCADFASKQFARSGALNATQTGEVIPTRDASRAPLVRTLFSKHFGDKEDQDCAT